MAELSSSCCFAMSCSDELILFSSKAIVSLISREMLFLSGTRRAGGGAPGGSNVVGGPVGWATVIKGEVVLFLFWKGTRLAEISVVVRDGIEDVGREFWWLISFLLVIWRRFLGVKILWSGWRESLQTTLYQTKHTQD